MMCWTWCGSMRRCRRSCSGRRVSSGGSWRKREGQQERERLERDRVFWSWARCKCEIPARLQHTQQDREGSCNGVGG